ncbi:hypothetical protein QE152_g36563 [Popillia japonica]|uniref:Uncharacterized protein n=1 Tax=Popillia japonica TaxID=7064 RepID=A0AAW1ID63_POPJA
MSSGTRSQKSKISQKIDKATKKNNSYVEVIQDIVVNSDNLKNESDIINEMRDKLAKTDFEINELKEALQACKENEVLLKNKIEFITKKNRKQQDLIKQLQETIERLSNPSKTITICTPTQTNRTIKQSV